MRALSIEKYGIWARYVARMGQTKTDRILAGNSLRDQLLGKTRNKVQNNVMKIVCDGRIAPSNKSFGRSSV
jgi:hypothetical protein